jgi:hypothetical protein
MNERAHGFRVIALLAIVAASLTMVLAVLGPGVAGQPGQSPLSPVAALGWPNALKQGFRWERLLSESFWTSPLPWAAIGLILFSTLARPLARVLRQAQAAERARKESPLPPEWAP